MGLGIRKGKVTFCKDLAALAEFFGRERVLKVQMWDFEKGGICQIAVTARGSHGSLVVRGYSSTAVRLLEGLGWPAPKIHARPLPGALYYQELWEVPAPKEPEPEEHTPRVNRVRRIRAAVA